MIRRAQARPRSAQGGQGLRPGGGEPDRMRSGVGGRGLVLLLLLLSLLLVLLPLLLLLLVFYYYCYYYYNYYYYYYHYYQGLLLGRGGGPGRGAEEWPGAEIRRGGAKTFA